MGKNYNQSLMIDRVGPMLLASHWFKGGRVSILSCKNSHF